jgi:hypothetical protein
VFSFSYRSFEFCFSSVYLSHLTLFSPFPLLFFSFFFPRFSSLSCSLRTDSSSSFSSEPCVIETYSEFSRRDSFPHNVFYCSASEFVRDGHILQRHSQYTPSQSTRRQQAQTCSSVLLVRKERRIDRKIVAQEEKGAVLILCSFSSCLPSILLQRNSVSRYLFSFSSLLLVPHLSLSPRILLLVVRLRLLSLPLKRTSRSCRRLRRPLRNGREKEEKGERKKREREIEERVFPLLVTHLDLQLCARWSL